MTANTHSIPQYQASSTRRFAKAMPVALTLLVWLFAASMETGFIAFVNAGIQPAGQTLGIA